MMKCELCEFFHHHPEHPPGNGLCYFKPAPTVAPNIQPAPVTVTDGCDNGVSGVQSDQDRRKDLIQHIYDDLQTWSRHRLIAMLKRYMGSEMGTSNTRQLEAMLEDIRNRNMRRTEP